MIEKTPEYFVEFAKGFNEFKKEVNQKFDSIDHRFDKIDEEFEKVHEKLDTHFETIGELKVQVTCIDLMLKEKANHSYVKDIDNRVEKLEKVVFA